MRMLVLFLFLATGKTSWALNVQEYNGRLEDFVERKRISLVFASQNLSIPETLFGHTFVVAHDEPYPEPDATVLEFVGLPDGRLWTYVSAVTSSIQGKYQLKSFHQKQREYDLENRDFWVYPYTGSVEDRKILVEKVSHLLKDHRSPYNFISKNCATASYVVLSNLPLEQPYVLPVATIQWLQSEGLLGESEFHPSGLRTALHTYQELSSDEKQSVREALTLSGWSERSSSPKTLGALNAGLNFRIVRVTALPEQQQLFQMKKNIFERSKETTPVLPPDPPEERSQRESIVIGRGLKAYSFEFRPAQRDFFSSSRDGLETSFLEVAKLRGELVQGAFKLSEVTLFRLDVQNPPTPYSEAFTRWIEVGYWDWQRQAAERKGELVAHYGWGYSLRLGAVTAGLLPFVGMTKGVGLDQSGMDFGFRVAINAWLSERLALQSVFKHRWQVDRQVMDTLEAGMLYRIRPNWRWGIGWIKAGRPLETVELKSIFTF